VDAATEGSLSWWTSLFVTDQPDPAVNNATQVDGLLPQNGIGINFDGQCNTSGAIETGVGEVYTYSNYVETRVPTTSSCFTTHHGSLNNIEVDLSQTRLTVWASDFSPDGVTFPTFRQMLSVPVNLDFSTGWVHFQTAERAPIKYAAPFHISPGYAVNYWSDIAFDGPMLDHETGYMVPDSLRPDPDVSSPDIGYPLVPSVTVSIPGVNPNVNSAELTFEMSFTFTNTLTASNVALHLSVNGHAEITATANYAAEHSCSGCPGPSGGGGVPYVVSVPVDQLVSGSNSFVITADNTWLSYPATMTSMDVLTFGPTA
jgi:hypothetical protein